jgi:hypothetical protein
MMMGAIVNVWMVTVVEDFPVFGFQAYRLWMKAIYIRSYHTLRHKLQTYMLTEVRIDLIGY